MELNNYAYVGSTDSTSGYLIKSGYGELKQINYGNLAGSLDVYDTSDYSTGFRIANLTNAADGFQPFNVAFSRGLRVVTSTSTPYTILYS